MARRSSDDLKEVIRDFRRDQVIDVARRLFGERGTTEVSMDEIAAEAGVARSTVYVYFSNRDDLLRACLTRMYEQLLDGIAAARERDRGPAQRLRTLVDGMLARIDDSPAFFLLALTSTDAVARRSTAIGSELAVIGLEIAGLIRDVYVEGVAAGTFRPMDPDLATALIGQQIYGAMSVRAGDPAPRPRPVAVEEICSFMLHGLSA